MEISSMRTNILENYFIKGGLNKKQIGFMHEKALHLVENVGVYIPHKGILKLLANYDGVKIERENVKFNNDLVLNALKEAQYPLPEYAKKNWIISSGANQTKIYDLNSGEIRETTLKDLIEMTRFCDSLNTVGAAPVVPLDVQYYLQEILMHKISYEYSRFKANDIFEITLKPTYESAYYVYEMAKAANKWFAIGLYMISPKTFDRKELDIVYRFLDKGVPMWAGTMPIAGIGAPITIQGAMLQSMFETFASLTMLNLINRKSYNYIQFIDSFIAPPFDMKYINFVYGSPEDIRATLYKISIHKYYKIPIVAKSLLTTSKEPDAHAAFEVGAHTLIAALAGVRAFRCGGLLNSGELYSAEQLLICYEIVEYIKNMLKEEEFSEERLMLNEISEVGPGQSYIGRKSTFENFRKEYWEPELFIHSNLGQWKEMGSKSIWKCANEIVKKRINEHSYQIEKHIKKELDKMYEFARDDEELKKSYQL
jgi:trimethylamine--corrinoid protein Co-methyltransferase